MKCYLTKECLTVSFYNGTNDQECLAEHPRHLYMDRGKLSYVHHKLLKLDTSIPPGSFIVRHPKAWAVQVFSPEEFHKLYTIIP